MPPHDAQPVSPEALAEARDDLDRLIKFTTDLAPADDWHAAEVALVRGFLANPAWDDLMLATVLGAAVVRLSRKDAADADTAA